LFIIKIRIGSPSTEELNWLGKRKTQDFQKCDRHTSNQIQMSWVRISLRLMA